MSVWTVASLICVVLLGAIKFKSKARYWIMAVGFCASEVLIVLTYLATDFVPMCALAFVGAFLNCAGNSVFNAALKLALPEDNRGAILGFIQSASVGGSALSAVIYGFLGDVFPLYLVFAAGSILGLVPMLNLCLNKKTKDFVLNH